MSSFFGGKKEEKKDDQLKKEDQTQKQDDQQKKQQNQIDDKIQILETYDFNSLKGGEYQIHVFIEETRNLISSGESKQIDPVIQIEAFNQKQLSLVKKQQGSGMIFWGEHKFFSKVIDSPSEIQSEKMKIQIMDYKLIQRNSLIGSFEIDLVSIYFSDEHAIQHKWVALSNSEKDFQQITGFLKFSCQVYTRGDKQILLKEEELKSTTSSKDLGLKQSDEEEFNFGGMDILLPPQIKTQGYYLKITLLRGQKFVKMDTYGSIDPFLIFEFGESRYKTKIIKDKQNPEWGYIIYLPYSEPMISQTLNVKLFDYDFGRTDELVGSANFLKTHIINNKYRSPFWVNIYGSQLGSGNTKKQMIQNNCPDLGSFWKGRIFMKIESEIAEKPQQKTIHLENSEQQKYMANESMELEIHGDIYYGVEFEQEKGEYSIRIRIADEELDFGKQVATNGVWKWYCYKSKKIVLPCKDSADIPDVFIYLMYGETAVSFIRRPFKYFNLMREEAELYQFTPDIAKSDGMRPDLAGTVKMQIHVGFSGTVNIKYQRANVTECPKKGTIICNVFNCQNLLPGDENGTSDPFLTATYYGQTVKTETIEDTLNPLFNQRIVMKNIDIFDITKNPPPIIIKLFDQDLIGSDFLGTAVIDLKQMHQNNHLKFNAKNVLEDQPIPVWVDLKYGKQDNCGRVLISFHLYDHHTTQDQLILSTIPQQINIPTEKYFIKLKILGLRDLQSLGLIPVKNAFLKIDINSLLPKTSQLALKTQKFITTQPKESGPNPNISTIVEFDVQLPIDLNYCPHLSVIVFDRIMKGFLQPILGQFTIDLPKYIQKTKNYYQFKVNKAVDFLLLNTKEQRNVISDNLGFDVDEVIKQKKTVNLIKSKESNALDDLLNFEKMIDSHANLNTTNLASQDLTEELLFEDKQEKKKQQEIELQLQQKQLNIDLFEENEKKKETINDALEQLEQNGVITDEQSIVKFAEYHYDKKQKQILEISIPDQNKFIGLSWDPKASRLGKKVNRHYRYFVKKNLEETLFMDEHTFDEFDIMRGCRSMTKGFFGFGSIVEEDSIKQVGKFKGWLEIISEKQKNIFKKNLIGKAEEQSNNNSQNNISSNSKLMKKRNVNGDQEIEQKLVKRGQLDNEFLVQQSVIIRVYILDCIGLAQLDDDSLSDPYVMIKLGNQVVDDSQNYQSDQTNCDIYKMYELKGSLPGISQLHIQLWDKDNFVADDLIGETIIDLENRYYSKKWRNLAHKPIECRELFVPTSMNSRGQIRMFLEITPSKEALLLKEVWQISPKPKQDYELRVVVWDCEDCPSMDAEDTSDLFVTAILGDQRQSTDTHFRSQTGTGSFNWRMKFNISLPSQSPTITFQIWDKDIVANDFISEATFSFQDMVDKAFNNDCSIKLAGNQSQVSKIGQDFGGNIAKVFDKESSSHKEDRSVQKYTMHLKNIIKQGYVTKGGTDVGKLTISMELVPLQIALQNNVGKGREEPNHSPWLPPPVGRFEFSWNPLTLFFRLVGPKARKQVCLFLVLFLCIAIFISIFPVIFGGLVVRLISRV